MINLVDQSKPCTQIYLKKICMLHKFAITNTIFLHRLLKICIIIKRTCISIFSKIGFVDQSNPCTQITSCRNMQQPIVIFKKLILSEMRHCKTSCISIFSKLRLVDQSKPCTPIYLQKMASCMYLELLIVI